MSTTTSRIAPRAQRTSFAMPGLEVHAAQHAARRARVVVLDQLVEHAELGEAPCSPEGLQEEAARVAVHGGLDQDRALEACLQAAHAAPAIHLGRRSGRASASDEVAAGRGRVAHVQGALGLRDHEVVHQPAVARQRLGAHAGEAAVEVAGPELGHVVGGRGGEARAG